MTPRDPASHPVVDRWGRDVEADNDRGLFAAAYRRWFRVEWEGLDHLPRDGGALLVSNHAGMMPVDGGIIWHGVEREIGRQVYMLAHHGFFRLPFMGSVLNRMGTVVANPDNAHRLLHEDQSLVLVFPEGEKGPVKPRSEKYRLQRFGRGGFVETAARAGVPIVPIVLLGTEDATPTVADLVLNGQKMPLTANALLLGPILGAVAPFPVKIKARVLPPVHVEGACRTTPYPRSLLMDQAEAIRTDMQAAMDEMLDSRASIWFG